MDQETWNRDPNWGCTDTARDIGGDDNLDPIPFEEFKALVDNHDWTYMHADGPAYWKGLAAYNKLQLERELGGYKYDKYYKDAYDAVWSREIVHD